MSHNPSRTQAIEQALNTMLKGTVPVISAEKLQLSLESDPSWLVIDSRTSCEFAISHLPNACWAGQNARSFCHKTKVSKDCKIVVYCSIGVRSERFAEHLMSAGFTQVYNLYGGIFNWANNGMPLVDQLKRSTTNVHGYDKQWAKLVLNPVGV